MRLASKGLVDIVVTSDRSRSKRAFAKAYSSGAEAVFLVDVESAAILASNTQAKLMTGPSCRVSESIAAVNTIEAVLKS
jgi:hypothetical protein